MILSPTFVIPWIYILHQLNEITLYVIHIMMDSPYFDIWSDMVHTLEMPTGCPATDLLASLKG